VFAQRPGHQMIDSVSVGEKTNAYKDWSRKLYVRIYDIRRRSFKYFHCWSRFHVTYTYHSGTSLKSLVSIACP
jgi:hypothetical protein